MEVFHMTDIIPLIGISYPPVGRTSYNVACPCCDDKPRAKHMNINLKRDVFRCPRCGISGGIFDLYALYTGVPRDKVREDIISRIGNPRLIERQEQKPVPQPVITECPITDIETRHATYSALLSKLSLAPDHRENLHNRGLNDSDIDRLGYKTTPVAGSSAIAKQLRSEGMYLAGVPGFYRTESDVWAFIHEQRGVLIPVRNPRGLIQGLQIRRDNVEKRKFRWVSSADKK